MTTTTIHTPTRSAAPATILGIRTLWAVDADIDHNDTDRGAVRKLRTLGTRRLAVADQFLAAGEEEGHTKLCGMAREARTAADILAALIDLDREDWS